MTHAPLCLLPGRIAELWPGIRGCSLVLRFFFCSPGVWDCLRRFFVFFETSRTKPNPPTTNSVWRSTKLPYPIFDLIRSQRSTKPRCTPPLLTLLMYTSVRKCKDRVGIDIDIRTILTFADRVGYHIHHIPLIASTNEYLARSMHESGEGFSSLPLSSLVSQDSRKHGLGPRHTRHSSGQR